MQTDNTTLLNHIKQIREAGYWPIFLYDPAALRFTIYKDAQAVLSLRAEGFFSAARCAFEIIEGEKGIPHHVEGHITQWRFKPLFGQMGHTIITIKPIKD